MVRAAILPRVSQRWNNELKHTSHHEASPMLSLKEPKLDCISSNFTNRFPSHLLKSTCCCDASRCDSGQSCVKGVPFGSSDFLDTKVNILNILRPSATYVTHEVVLLSWNFRSFRAMSSIASSVRISWQRQSKSYSQVPGLCWLHWSYVMLCLVRSKVLANLVLTQRPATLLVPPGLIGWSSTFQPFFHTAFIEVQQYLPLWNSETEKLVNHGNNSKFVKKWH